MQLEGFMSIEKEKARERTREIQAQFAEKGDALGWFDALYKEAANDNEKIPWADLEPNAFLRRFAEENNLNRQSSKGSGRRLRSRRRCAVSI